MTATPTIAAPAASGAAGACSVYRAADGTTVRHLSADAIAERFRAGEGALWVDIDGREPTQVELLERVFGFHPLAIEDVRSPDTRVKLDEYAGYLFLAIRGVRFCDETEDPYDVETVSLYFFLGPTFLVSVHSGEARTIRSLDQRANRATELLGKGVARLLHGIVDETVDAFFPILDRLDDFVDGLEERVFTRFDRTSLRDIFHVKRLVLTLRRQLAPQREVMSALANRPSEYIPDALQPYFRDVYDHVLRINDSLEGYRDLLSSTLDSYLTQVSNRLGNTTKTLSVIATLTLPFIIVSGMWGMNFRDMPLSGSPHGFWIMLVVQLGLGAVFVALLRWRNLL